MSDGTRCVSCFDIGLQGFKKFIIVGIPENSNALQGV